jgi:uncharacterized protein YraI
MKKVVLLLIALTALLQTTGVRAQDELAATLEVLSAGVTVQRVNTTNPINVTVEAIVGVGDIIRTDDKGHARITFFADGTDTELLPNTEYLIEDFTGNQNQFRISVNVLFGQTRQRLNRLLDASSDYTINTPAMALVARGTEFDIRVENTQRSSMLVRDGIVNATQADITSEVNPSYGVRSDLENGLSDVVLASTFAELDAALDGCVASISSFEDTRINVRIGPNINLPRVGTISADEIGLFMGVSTGNQWYRINFRDGYGWIYNSTPMITPQCAGLRVFGDNHVEDITLYNTIGDPIEIDTDWNANLTAPDVEEVPEDVTEEAEADVTSTDGE